VLIHSTITCGRQHLLDPLGKALEGEALLTLVRAVCDSVFIVRHYCMTLHGAYTNLSHLRPHNSTFQSSLRAAAAEQARGKPSHPRRVPQVCCVSETSAPSIIAGAAHKAKLTHSAQRGHLEEKVSFGACFVCCEHRPSQAGQGPGAAAEELEKGGGGGRASVGCHRPPQLDVSVSSAGRCVVRPAIHVPSLVPVVSGVLVRPKSVWVAVWDRSSPFSVSRNHAYTWPCPSGLLSLFGACMGVRPCRTRLCSGLVDRACSAPRVWCREATGAWPGGAPRLACSKRA